MAAKITVSHEFVGFGDYWGGNGRRWDNDAGCAFAYYGRNTTLRDCVDQWVDDWGMGGDFEHNGDGRDPWEDVTDDDIRAAILDSLTEQGRADYDSGALAECAEEYARDGDPPVCRDCGEALGSPHCEDCVVLAGLDDEDDHNVTDDDCDDPDEYSESPIWVILIEIEQCSECGAGDEHVIDDICAACADKHGYAV